MSGYYDAESGETWGVSDSQIEESVSYMEAVRAASVTMAKALLPTMLALEEHDTEESLSSTVHEWLKEYVFSDWSHHHSIIQAHVIDPDLLKRAGLNRFKNIETGKAKGILDQAIARFDVSMAQMQQIMGGDHGIS